MCMEYFKKLQCYKPKKAIIDSPISIEEVALLQNSVDKDILGRIKFINRSQQFIIAIFVHLSASNIAGEPVTIERERCIYQDMKIEPGELYGNKIPLHLPDDARLLTVKLEKIVFENGEIWNAATGIECEYIPQEEIKISEQIKDKVQEEFSPYFSHMEYIHYFYKEGQNFWECTCGKINDASNDKCSFCKNSKESQEKYLISDNLDSLIREKMYEKKLEDEEKQKEAAKIERLKKEKEQKKQEEAKKRCAEEERLLKINEKKFQRKIIAMFLVIGILVIIAVFISAQYTKKEKMEAYQKGVEAYQSKDYDKAIKEFTNAGNYNDAEVKLSVAMDCLTEKDRQNLEKCINISYFTSQEKEGLIDALCYLGKTKKYIKNNADFMVNANEIKSDDYICEYNIEYDFDFDFQYIELLFSESSPSNQSGDNAILTEISFYGDSSLLDADDINRLLSQEYDEEHYNWYSWNISEKNDIFSKVLFEDGGYETVDLGNNTSKHCNYELSFYK